MTREVRFSINEEGDSRVLSQDKPYNSYAGFPSHRSTLARFYRLQVTLEGELRPETGYLRNIKEIDAVVRAEAIRIVAAFNGFQERGAPVDGFIVGNQLFGTLRGKWPGARLHSVALWLTPYVCITQLGSEFEMATRLSTKFEFSASHRLHNPRLSDEENRRCYGKCNNPHGHGHNYEVQVTLAGPPGSTGMLGCVPEIERVVAETVIERFDHKNLNVEVAEFKELNPSVENIAMVIYRLLKPKFAGGDGGKLAAVTVWETPKTWCEYSE